MFPYPSGDLHLGHVRNYAIADTIAKYKRIKGYNAVVPMGWDAFGLPAENAAIAHGVMPSDWTRQNIQRMKSQMETMQMDIDWSREITTNDPDYYRWTQWFFVKMVEEGIAYQKEGIVNYDPIEKTVLANEQVDSEGRAWRSGAKVEQRAMTQWYINISRYADEMIDDIDSSGMPDRVKNMQRNWIANIQDWCVSRQRYWGTPIPVVHCDSCGAVPVPASQLPVKFPTPTGEWKDYDEQIQEWKHQVTCPKCGKPAQRETDTMDTFVDSAWYFFRYTDPTNTETPFSPEKCEEWMPMAYYIGGIEHATAHLVYSRFFARFIRDIGMFQGNEPFSKQISQGMVIGKTYKDSTTGQYIPCQEVSDEMEVEVTWEKMSKSKFNGVSPEQMIAKYGVDTVRTYIAFKAPVEKDMQWDESDIQGTRRFINRIHSMEKSGSGDRDPEMQRQMVKFWKEYCRNMDNIKFNTAIAIIMKFSRHIIAAKDSRDKDRAIWVIRKAISPFAPSFK